MSKVSKQRPCPAVGHGISAATCGEQRESRLKCPADCSYNPFNPSNPEQLRELEERVDAMSLKRFKAEGPVPPREQFTNMRTTEEVQIGTHSYFSWNLFLARNAEPDHFY